MITTDITDINFYYFKVLLPYSGNTDPSKPHEGKPSCGYFCDVCGHWDFHFKRCNGCQLKEKASKDNTRISFKTKNGVRLVDITDARAVQWAINPDMSSNNA